MYKLAHFLRDKMPFVWDLIEALNSFLFSVRYGRKLLDIDKMVLSRKYGNGDYSILRLSEVSSDDMSDFFAHQPEEAYRFFRPHKFDKKSIKKLQKNRSFLAYVIKDGQSIAGYYFIRAFFHGKGFRGRMVDINYRGKGLGTMMNKLMNEVGFGIGLRLFETVSKDNIASYRSALSASKVKVIEEMDNNELFLEIVNDNQSNN